ALSPERFLEHLRAALEAGIDRDRQARVALDVADRVDRLAQRGAGCKIEGDGHRRLVAVVGDLQRTDRGDDTRHRRQRDRLPRWDAVAVHPGARPRPRPAGTTPPGHVGLHEYVLQLRRIGLKPGLALEDHLVVVGSRVDGRHLPRAEGVEQFLTNLIDGDAVDGRLFAVDLNGHLRVLDV